MPGNQNVLVAYPGFFLRCIHFEVSTLLGEFLGIKVILYIHMHSIANITELDNRLLIEILCPCSFLFAIHKVKHATRKPFRERNVLD